MPSTTTTPEVTQLIQALGFFKDWSNYLLVTTVAALGWVASKPERLPTVLQVVTLVSLCLSIVFAIFTLALIPIVGELLTNTKSFYETKALVKPLFDYYREIEIQLKDVCWLQHVFFLLGIISFSAGSIWRAFFKISEEES